MKKSSSSLRIAFFSANAGTGHDSAAKAIAQEIVSRDKSIHYKIINSYEFIKQPMRKIMEDGYIPLIRFLPNLYRYFYERKDKKSSIKLFKSLINGSAVPRIKKFINREKPDVIVCTHAFPCGVLADMKRKGIISNKIIGVVTDYVVNPFWIYPQVDLYTIASKELIKIFIERGISKYKIKVTGIPINPHFKDCNIPRNKLKERLGLSIDRPTILIMGGGLGMNPVTQSLRIIKKIKVPVNSIIFMGKNESRKTKMEKALSKLEHLKQSVKILGYVNNIFEYMKGADLLITKPGGMTTTEAITAGLPMIITDPLPGQENQNVKYLINKKLAVLSENNKDLPGIIENLLRNPKIIKEMSHRAVKFAVADSSNQIANHIFSVIT